VGRCISPDTVVPGAGALPAAPHDATATTAWQSPTTAGPQNPQEINRYSYALNNPMRYNDPSGHVADPFDEKGGAKPGGDGTGGGTGGGSGGAPTNPAPPLSPSLRGVRVTDKGVEPLYKWGSWRQKTFEEAESVAPRNEQGEMICPTCGKVIPKKVIQETKKGSIERRGYDLDHYPDTWAERKAKLQETNPPPTRKQVLDEFNRDVRVQCPACNQRHEFEGKPGIHAGPR
jgi:uncharacterized Zn finger protein (UPF0148 family)